MAILYQILNKANNKKYIGVTDDKFYRRKAVHLYKLRRNSAPQVIQDDFNLYGEKSFVFTEIETGDLDYLLKKEEECTETGSYEYNTIVGGNSSRARKEASLCHIKKIKTDDKYRDDLSKKISSSLKGHKVSLETRMKMSALKRGEKCLISLKRIGLLSIVVREILILYIF